MRGRSRSRGMSCVELAVFLGIIGALIVFLAEIVVQKVERAEARTVGAQMCR